MNPCLANSGPAGTPTSTGDKSGDVGIEYGGTPASDKKSSPRFASEGGKRKSGRKKVLKKAMLLRSAMSPRSAASRWKKKSPRSAPSRWKAMSPRSAASRWFSDTSKEEAATTGGDTDANAVVAAGHRENTTSSGGDGEHNIAAGLHVQTAISDERFSVTGTSVDSSVDSSDQQQSLLTRPTQRTHPTQSLQPSPRKPRLRWFCESLVGLTAYGCAIFLNVSAAKAETHWKKVTFAVVGSLLLVFVPVAVVLRVKWCRNAKNSAAADRSGNSVAERFKNFKALSPRQKWDIAKEGLKNLCHISFAGLGVSTFGELWLRVLAGLLVAVTGLGYVDDYWKYVKERLDEVGMRETEEQVDVVPSLQGENEELEDEILSLWDRLAQMDAKTEQTIEILEALLNRLAQGEVEMGADLQEKIEQHLNELKEFIRLGQH